MRVCYSQMAAEVTVGGDESRPIRPTRVCALTAQFKLIPVTLSDLSAAAKRLNNCEVLRRRYRRSYCSQ